MKIEIERTPESPDTLVFLLTEKGNMVDISRKSKLGKTVKTNKTSKDYFELACKSAMDVSN